MSIPTNPMKAVPVLLKRVKTARTKFHEMGRDESFDGKLDKLTRQLNKIEDVFVRVKNNQDALLDTLHEVDAHLRKLDRRRLDQDMDGICKRIRDCAHKLVPMDSFDDESCDEEKRGEIVQSSSHDPSSTQQYNNKLVLPQPQPPPPHVNPNMLKDMEDGKLRRCLLSLSIFPVNAVIKKTQVFYFWTGQGLNREEETGENVIDRLLRLNVIVPYVNDRSPIVKKFKLNPQICPQLGLFLERESAEHLGSYLRLGSYFNLRYYSTVAYKRFSLVLEQEKVTLGHEVKSVDVIYNISARYLNFGSKWMDKLEFLEVLQLGRWQDSASHHIEVVSQEFFKDLTNLKHLWYLSLRGISRIFELPPSIAQIKNLQILDLKACHNLETLPDDISSLVYLTHLILSQCYLLDGMPKGIEKLTQLQVLKGFIIGHPRNTPCTISDLANLKNLRRLSIHIRREAVIKDMAFESLKEMSALEHLKISWGVSDTRYSHIQIILPSSLDKLHLEGFPGQRIPEWLKPSKLPGGVKELKITGGKLESMNHDEDMIKWGIEIVRLKYLKHLEVDLTNLQMLFPSLRYALVKPFPNRSFTEWSID